jgi:radical SAM protein with 4Fe4S-binding SPASM domain
MTALVSGRRSPIEQEAFAAALRLEIPISLQLSLTARCNLGCVHCYSVSQAGPELSPAEVADLLAQAAAAGTFMLVLTGGEVFCRPDLPAILERALDLRFATKLYTNATLIDDGAADMIAETGVHQVHVSVYSAEAAVHDAITGAPGSLAASLAAVERLRRRSVRVMLKCVIMKPNLASFRSVLRLAEELGASCAFDSIVTVRNDGDGAPLALRLGHDDLVTVFSTPEIADAAGDEAVPGEFAYAGEIADAPPCAAGFNNCAVWPNGDVTPCVGFTEVAGNLRRATLEEIWKQSPVFLRVRSTRIRDIEVCASCADVRQCGRCPGSAMLEDGNVMGPSRAACQMAAARRAAAGKEIRQ